MQKQQYFRTTLNNCPDKLNCCFSYGFSFGFIGLYWWLLGCVWAGLWIACSRTAKGIGLGWCARFTQGSFVGLLLVLGGHWFRLRREASWVCGPLVLGIRREISLFYVKVPRVPRGSFVGYMRGGPWKGIGVAKVTSVPRERFLSCVWAGLWTACPKKLCVTANKKTRDVMRLSFCFYRMNVCSDAGLQCVHCNCGLRISVSNTAHPLMFGVLASFGAFFFWSYEGGIQSRIKRRSTQRPSEHSVDTVSKRVGQMPNGMTTLNNVPGATRHVLFLQINPTLPMLLAEP